MVEFCGWLGSLLLITCCLPQVYKTYKTKIVDGLSLIMMLMWAFGCYFMLIYESFGERRIPLLLNYSLCSLFAVYLSYCIVKYRKK